MDYTKTTSRNVSTNTTINIDDHEQIIVRGYVGGLNIYVNGLSIFQYSGSSTLCSVSFDVDKGDVLLIGTTGAIMMYITPYKA